MLRSLVFLGAICAVQSVRVQLGMFNVSIGAGLTLKVLHAESGAVLLASTGGSFLRAVHEDVHFQQSGGIFNVNRSVTAICSAGNGTFSSPSASVLSGSLTMCGEARVDVTFTATSVQDPHDGQQLPLLDIDVEIASSGPAGFNALTMVSDMAPGVGVFGLGEQYTLFNQRGSAFDVIAREQGVGRGLEPVSAYLDLLRPGSAGDTYTTYTSVPQWVRSDGQGLFLADTAFAHVDFTGASTANVTVSGPRLQARVTAALDVPGQVQAYTAWAGRQAPLPAWVGAGAVVGLQGGDAAVRGNVTQFLDFVAAGLDTPYPPSGVGLKAPLAGAWMQDWSGQRVFKLPDTPRTGLWWNWQYDHVEYADWPGTVQWLAAHGVQTLSYVNPMLANVSARVPAHYSVNYAQVAADKGYCVHVMGDGGVPECWRGYGDSLLLDLTNPAAAEWYKDIIVTEMLKPAVGGGVSGWMADFGEAWPYNAVTSSGEALPADLHNAYPVMWAELNKRAVEEAGLSGHVAFFSRSASQRGPSASPLYWMGDQMVTFDDYDGMQTAVVAMLSSGLSGFALTHSDIGGYVSTFFPPFLNIVRTQEVQLRWSELGAFQAMYRSHLGTQPEHCVQSYTNNATMRQFLRMARLFRALAPIRQACMKEHVATGAPIARPMFWHFPATGFSWSHAEELKQQFMFGEHLLVAPVLTANVTSRSVWLPPATAWVHVWSARVVQGTGDFVEVQAPIGEPPLFFRNDVPAGRSAGASLVLRLQHEGLLPA